MHSIEEVVNSIIWTAKSVQKLEQLFSHECQYLYLSAFMDCKDRFGQEHPGFSLWHVETFQQAETFCRELRQIYFPMSSSRLIDICHIDIDWEIKLVQFIPWLPQYRSLEKIADVLPVKDIFQEKFKLQNELKKIISIQLCSEMIELGCFASDAFEKHGLEDWNIGQKSIVNANKNIQHSVYEHVNSCASHRDWQHVDRLLVTHAYSFRSLFIAKADAFVE